MSVAQGINKIFAYKKQANRGAAAAGNGGQKLRRETATMSRGTSTFSNNEIVSHQQHTGDQAGIRSSSGTVSGVLSPGTYSDHLDSLLRKNRTATANIAGASLTLAAEGTNYRVTRAAGSFLTDGVKVGQVVRLSGMNAANNGINLLVFAVSALFIKVTPLNNAALIPEGPVAGAGVTIPGKQTWVPTTDHTNDYYTFEEWFSDIARSHTWPDVQIAGAQIGMPATGNVTFSETLMGLGGRVKGNAQVLTAPTDETTTPVTVAVAGAVVVNGVRQMSVTSANVSIEGGITAGEATIGSNTSSDTQKGRIRVTGTFTALYEDDVIAQPYDDGTPITLLFVVAGDNTGTAPFIALALPEVKVFSDDADDGEKQIIRTFNFTGQIAASGGPALASYATILQIHDSAAS